MNTVTRIIAVLVVFGLSACDNNDDELKLARAKINNLQNDIIAVKVADTILRADLEKETKAKKEHAIAEEKFKNFRKQAVADLNSALEKLRACQGHKSNLKKRK